MTVDEYLDKNDLDYDDVILKFKLTWEQVGPRYTLKAMKLL